MTISRISVRARTHMILMRSSLLALITMAFVAVAIGQTGSRLVFSKVPINPADPAALTTSFVAGDPIYGLLILDRPLREFAAENSVPHRQLGYNVTRPSLAVEIKIDGTPIYDGTHYFVWDLENKVSAWDSVPSDRHFFFDVAPDPANIKTYAYPKMHFDTLSAVGRPGNRAKAGAQFYSHHIGKLGSGSHRVDFKVTGKSSVTGGFTIADGNFAHYTQLATKLDSAAAQTSVMPSAQSRDAAIETSVRTAVRAAGMTDAVQRVVLTSPAWYVQRGPLGQILFRGMYAAVAFKKADGSCYYINGYFKQDHAGGRYGATRLDGRPNQTAIACGNINK